MQLVSAWPLRLRPFVGTLKTTMAVAASLLGCIPVSAAEDTEAVSRDKELVERWYTVYDELHDSLVVRMDGDSKASPALTSNMVLTQYNPSEAQGVRHGRVYLWTVDGKPAVIGGIWSIPNRTDNNIRNICYEFHSLSQQPVMVEKNRARIWRCDQPGVQWQQHRGPETPATGRTARLVQMREIARSYQAVGRLLPQPLYRYPEETGGVADGAIFAFTEASDPQVFLLLKTEDDRWSVAFARSNILPRQAKHQDEIVWAVEQFQGNWDGIIRSDSAPFFIHHTLERRFADSPKNILSAQP